MEWKKVRLGRIADYVTSSIKSDHIDLDEYVTTDSMLQNKCGRVEAVNLPPNPCTLTRFQKGDVLVANIRPYLKKLWLADCDGGCSTDVLVFRAKEQHSSRFLYHVLMQDIFFDYVMKGAKGSKMPRGDKRQIMSFPVPALDFQTECRIASVLSALDRKIALNRAINHNLEAMAKQLYDYWFVQFDFPDSHGRPYRASGGKMVFCPELNCEIPEGWQVKRLDEIAEIRKGSLITKKKASVGNIKVVAAGIDYSYTTENSNRPANVITISASGANAGFVNFWREPIFASDCTTVEGNSLVDTILILFGLYKYQDVLFVAATGSAQPHVYPKQIGRLLFVDIPDNLKTKIAGVLEQTNFRIQLTINETFRLQTLRSKLLPLLMNGQVTVKE